MKPVLEFISFDDERSFVISKFQLPQFDAPWHYHPEYELTYIIRSSGKRFVSDSVENFSSGDLVLLGPNVPHYWKNAGSHEDLAESIVLQFKADLVNTDFFNLKEMSKISMMLNMSKSGIHFFGKDTQSIYCLMERLVNAKSSESVIIFLDILHHISISESKNILSSGEFLDHLNYSGTNRIKKICSFVAHNFKSDIRVNEVAELLYMTPEAFCRYFKKNVGRSFISYLNEFRIGYAKKLLVESDLSVSEIGYESGFNNLANFNRQFLKIVFITPSQFKSKFQSNYKLI